MNDMIIRNRNLGLESILQTAEERAPDGFKHIHDVLSQEELETTAISFKKAAGFDVETVNSRKSFVELAASPDSEVRTPSRHPLMRTSELKGH